MPENTPKKIFYPTNDYIFRRIFGTSGNENITKDFLNSIISDPIDSVSLSNNLPITQDNINDKYGILDVKATLNDKIACDIEMQVSKDEWMTSRALFYWSRLYSTQLKSGETYSELNKTIIILLLDYDDNIANIIPKICTTWHIREDNFPQYLLTNLLEFHIINISKLQKISIKKDMNTEKLEDLKIRKKLLSWLRFVINPEKLEDFDMENENIKEAKEKFDELQNDEIERELAFRRQMSIMDRKAYHDTAYNDGFREGTKNSIIEIAKKMKLKGISIEEIVEFTGLSKEEIEKL